MATNLKPNSNGTITGTAENDEIIWETSWNQAITVNAIDGNNLIDFSQSPYDNKLYGGNKNDTIYGGTGNDIIVSGSGADVALGGLGDDMIYGISGNNILKGNSGNDNIYGGTGNDKIYGGNGVDNLLGGIGNDTIYGENGNDFIKGGAGSDSLIGGTGNDFIEGGDGHDVIYGESGANTLKGQGGNDTVYGGTNNDIIYGGFGDDNLLGGKGNDVIYGEYGHNTLKGGEGHDTIYGGLNEDRIYGEKGNDTIYLSEDGGSLFFNNGDGKDVVKGIDQITNGNTIISPYNINRDSNYWTFVFKDSSLDDLKYVKSKDNLIIKYGANYSDSVTIENFFGYLYSEDRFGKQYPSYYASFSDIIKVKGSTGKALSIRELSPQIEIENINEGGTEFSDVFTVTNDDEISIISPISSYYSVVNMAGDNEFPDSIYFKDAKMEDLVFTVCGNDLQIGFNNVDGEICNHVVLRHYMTNGYSINIISSDRQTKNLENLLNEKGVSEGFTVSEDDEIFGTRFKDLINGTNKDNLIYGYENNDVIKGGQGKDTIVGGNGNDKLYGYDASHNNSNDGGNLLIGGNNNDTIYGASGNDTIYGDRLTKYDDDGYEYDVYEGNNVFDEGHQDGNDLIYAGAGNDLIYGGDGDDTIDAGAGNDTIYGDRGSEDKYGYDRNDLIYAGAGNDLIYGGYGNDTIYAGTGNDTIYCRDVGDTYVISNLSDLNTIYSYDDDEFRGDCYSDSHIILSDINHTDVIIRFDFEIVYSIYGRNLYITDDTDLYITRVADFGNTEKGIKVIDNLMNFENYGSSIESITAADGYYLTSSDIISLANSVASWLYANDFTSVQDVLDSGNQTNINALIAQFQNADWQHA